MWALRCKNLGLRFFSVLFRVQSNLNIVFLCYYLSLFFLSFCFCFCFVFFEHGLWRESCLSKDILVLFIPKLSVCIMVIHVSWLKYLAWLSPSEHFCLYNRYFEFGFRKYWRLHSKLAFPHRSVTAESGPVFSVLYALLPNLVRGCLMSHMAVLGEIVSPTLF